jgi:sortase (surface protein transpeptidase)
VVPRPVRAERRQSPRPDMSAFHRLASATGLWVVAMLLLGACSSADDSHASEAPTVEPRPPAQSHLSTYRSTRTHSETAPPVRLRIPSIEVETELEQLGRSPDKSIEVPRQPSSAGWWTGGSRPGQVGPAVILGHVDSRTGPAVFYRLRELDAGDEILVDRADGTTARFLVTSRANYDKDEFPSDLVYYPTLRAELRLVTCGGPFDRSTGHYRDNFVVFATQA